MMARGDPRVVQLPASDSWTPEQALAVAQRMAFEEVAVIGFTADGAVEVLHSRTLPAHLLWLAEELKRYAMGD